ncbi:MAG: FHA domain-containing protein [Nocardioides sp.]
MDLALCPDCGSPLWGMPTVAMEVTAPAQAPAQAGASAEHAIAVALSTAGPWVCPICQRTATGPECEYDGTPNPVPGDGPSVAPSTAPVLDVRLPDGSVIALAEHQPLDIGRHSANRHMAAALRDYDGVSRRHATLTVSGCEVIVVDHNSSNGTRVNGIPVHSEARESLASIRTVQLGRHAVLHLSRHSLP